MDTAVFAKRSKTINVKNIRQISDNSSDKNIILLA